MACGSRPSGACWACCSLAPPGRAASHPGRPRRAFAPSTGGTMQKIGVLGTGAVGTMLADGFLGHGYDVTRGSRDPAKLKDWLAKAGPKARTGTFAEAARAAEIVVLAVKGDAAEAVVDLAGADALAGKVV